MKHVSPKVKKFLNKASMAFQVEGGSNLVGQYVCVRLFTSGKKATLIKD